MTEVERLGVREEVLGPRDELGLEPLALGLADDGRRARRRVAARGRGRRERVAVLGVGRVGRAGEREVVHDVELAEGRPRLLDGVFAALRGAGDQLGLRVQGTCASGTDVLLGVEGVLAADGLRVVERGSMVALAAAEGVELGRGRSRG